MRTLIGKKLLDPLFPIFKTRGLDLDLPALLQGYAIVRPEIVSTLAQVLVVGRTLLFSFGIGAASYRRRKPLLFYITSSI